MLEFLNQDPGVLALWLFGALVFSSAGIYFFKEGKRRGHTLWIVIGIVLFLYTYFTPSVWAVWLVGSALVLFGYKTR